MEPFSIAIIGAILGAVATQTPRALRTLKRAIVGKKVCALGPKQVGKSTFLEFLSKGMVIGIDEYRSTVSSVKLGGREVVVSDKNSNQEIKIELKAMIDVGGQKANMNSEWKARFSESDIIFYIVNAGDLIEERGTATKDLEKGMKLLASWITEYGKKSTKKWIFLIGNYWNTETDFNKMIEDRQGAYQAKFADCQAIKDAVMTLSAAWASLPTKKNVVVTPQVAAFSGCLLSKTSIENVLLHTLRTIANSRTA